MKRLLIAFFVILGLAALLAVLIVVLGVPPTSEPQQPETQKKRLLVPDATDPAKGQSDAPITVIVLSSFNCPSCKETAVQLDQLRALYPEQVRVVWKDLPDSIGDAYQAALAARCAQLQGKFWQFHDLLFAKQGLLANRGLYSLWAGELGLSVDRFDACLEGQETKPWVDANIAQALQSGVELVPHVQINDTTYAGPQTLIFYRTAVERIIESSS